MMIETESILKKYPKCKAFGLGEERLLLLVTATKIMAV
jgi:hypothetical protein